MGGSKRGGVGGGGVGGVEGEEWGGRREQVGGG